MMNERYTLRETGAGARGDAEAGGGHPEGAHVLLGLKEDDVDLGREEAAQHHRAAQADRDAHGRGLHLKQKKKKKKKQKSEKSYRCVSTGGRFGKQMEPLLCSFMMDWVSFFGVLGNRTWSARLVMETVYAIIWTESDGDTKDWGENGSVFQGIF